MNRRTLITLIGGAAASGMSCPFVARAQQPDRVRRIGVLMTFAESDPEAQVWVAAFMKSLRDLGWRDGRAPRVAYRFAGGDPGRLDAQAAELAALAPDAILTVGTPATVALRRETAAVPIVFTNVADPVSTGLVASLAHPGGNMTGFTSAEYSLGGKWLELLKEVAPAVTRAAFVHNPQNVAHIGQLQAIQAFAPKLGMQVIAAGVRDAPDIERSFDALPRASIDSVIVYADLITAVHRELIVGLTARHRLPAVYSHRYFAASGGLMVYGVDSPDMFRRAASYVDRILRGEKPADLPVQLPTKLELVVNLKAAKAIGLAIPESFLLRADEVIE
jgi:putative ABC transport system substrate-binding protein